MGNKSPFTFKQVPCFWLAELQVAATPRDLIYVSGAGKGAIIKLLLGYEAVAAVLIHGSLSETFSATL